MGFLSTDPSLRKLQFRNRKFVGISLLGVTAVTFLLFQTLSVLYDHGCPSCSRPSVHATIRRWRRSPRASEDEDDRAVPILDMVDEELKGINGGNKISATGAKCIKGIKAGFPEISTNKFDNEEEYKQWTYDFYDFYCSYFDDDSDIDSRWTDNNKQAEEIQAGISCLTEMKDIYADDWMVNDIYWCDSKDGWPAVDFNIAERQSGWIGLYFLGMLYMFLALAIVCDDYFVPALECITEEFQLSPDVAGATFMAAGGSAPELFTSIIGVFIADSNVGIGTIVGSAVFNILFVLGACAFVVGMVPDKDGNPTILNLTWFPLARDTIFYVIALLLLIASFTTGGARETVEWWESFLLFLVYIAYVTFMMFNQEIQEKITKDNNTPQEEAGEDEPLKQEKSGANRLASIIKQNKDKISSLVAERRQAQTDRLQRTKTTAQDDVSLQYAITRFLALNKADRAEDKEVEGEDGTAWENYFNNWKDQKTAGAKLYFLLSAPLTIPMLLTTPDMKLKNHKKWLGGKAFYLAFFMSIVWVIVFSYLMVWWATRIGETYNIDSSLMGLTFLAAGTSVPDLLTSVIVAKAGHGDMAVSSSIGSNLFDVTVGLPLPWLLFSAINSGKGKAVSSNGLGCSIGLLLLMLVVLIGSIVATGWKMNKQMGFSMLILYVAFVAVSLCLEYGVLTCPF